ncbi:MAG: ATP-binding protein [Caulobacteraceae bacterium]|nr:ATP-binding protein [Caulobacteraceae bacterium]
MLLRFGVSNFCSIHHPIEISFVASRAIKDRGPQLFEYAPKRDALPVLLLYGANASGKTTLFKALISMRNHVLNSFAKRAPSDAIKHTPFALNEIAAKEPTRLECDFLLDGIRYHYGFEYDAVRYRKEWLYSYPEGQPRLLYERDSGNIDGISFGKNLRGQNRVIESFTRPNSLFLSTAAQNAHPHLSEVYRFFAEKLFFVSSSFSVQNTVRGLKGDLDPRIVSFLRMADTGITGARIQKVEPKQIEMLLYKDLSKALLPHLNNMIAGEVVMPDSPTPSQQLSLGHMTQSGEPVYLDFDTESRGTVRLITLLRMALQAIDTGGTLVVDELDVSLHTLLAREFVALFSRRETNPMGAQLLATTHDTNVLSSSYVRRDQVWFAEKASTGETAVYPLTDVRTRAGDNYEKAYLAGRYGAVPYLGDLGSEWDRDD